MGYYLQNLKPVINKWLQSFCNNYKSKFCKPPIKRFKVWNLKLKVWDCLLTCCCVDMWKLMNVSSILFKRKREKRAMEYTKQCALHQAREFRTMYEPICLYENH